MNFACPAPKVLRRGRGGAMLNNPDAVIDNVKAVQDAVSCPVLMKIRIGVDHSTRSSDNFWEIVTRAVELKVDALIIHGRTVSQDYGGKADWEPLAAAKRRFPQMTIIGSGDIHDPPATVGLMQRTGLDGFVVARGAVGNPWIFRDLRCVWENRPVPPPPSLAEQRLILFEHLCDMMYDYPERLCVSRFRKFLVGYTRRHPKRKQVLLDLLKTRTRAEVEAGIDAWYGVAPETAG
jgi:tRNA-dihydrouridine synthase B